MKPTMTVAICIPTYNQAPYLAQSVASACLQNFAAESLEIWLSDDCSSDETPQVVAELKREFPHLHTFRQEKNLGMSGNPRWVTSRPQTDYIVKLDSDDRLHPEYVAELVALLEAHPRAGYGHCAVHQIDESGEVQRVRRLRRGSGFEDAEVALRAAVQGYRVAANICIFRREALEAVDFLRTDMAFCDDWDLSVRLADAGWGNVYAAEVLADYRVWEDADQVRPRRKRDEVEGCIRVFEDDLVPAFARRGWDAAPLQKRRRALALEHCSVLDSPLFSPPERRELLRLLRVLGASPRLNLRVRLLRLGYGPFLRWQQDLKVKFRDKIKGLLVVARQFARQFAGQAKTFAKKT